MEVHQLNPTWASSVKINEDKTCQCGGENTTSGSCLSCGILYSVVFCGLFFSSPVCRDVFSSHKKRVSLKFLQAKGAPLEQAIMVSGGLQNHAFAYWLAFRRICAFRLKELLCWTAWYSLHSISSTRCFLSAGSLDFMETFFFLQGSANPSAKQIT